MSFFCISTNYAQVNLKNIEMPTPIQKNRKVLIFNTVGFNKNNLGALKDELIGWKEKVISITIDEKSNEFILIHNLLMDEQDLFSVLNKYGYAKKALISYK